MEFNQFTEIIKIEIPRIINTIKRKEIVIVNKTATEILLIQCIKNTISVIEAFKHKKKITGEDITFEEFKKIVGGTFAEYSYLLMTVNNYNVNIDYFEASIEKDYSRLMEYFFEDSKKAMQCSEIQNIISDEMLSLCNIAFEL